MERLKLLRTSRNMTQKQIAEYLGVDRTTYVKYETGSSEPNFSTIQTLADLYEVSVDYLLGRDSDFNSPPRDLSKYGLLPIKTKRIPLLGEVACGEPVFAAQDYESYVEVGTDIRADFALKAKGDSMVNARINDGDIVFVRSQPDVDDGQIAVVIIDDDATLKRVRRTNGLLMLMAENTAYPPLVYTEEQAHTIRIIGLAIAFQGDVK